jgi:predicted anti-sigma-YlaC factor YlaD
MACKDQGRNWDFLCSFLEEDIDSPLCRELKEHMQECPDCRANVESVKRTVALYRESVPHVPLSDAVKQRLIAALLSRP